MLFLTGIELDRYQCDKFWRHRSISITPFRYMECKQNKWDCKEGGGGGHFQRRKVEVACLNGDEIEREWKGIMMFSKWHHCQYSGDEKS